MNAHFCDVTQYSDSSLAQSANGDGVRYSSLAFMCFAKVAHVGSQLSLGTQASLPRDQVVGNPLSLYSSYLAPQAQHAPSAHDETIILALSQKYMSRRQTTFWHQREVLPGLPPSTLLLFCPRGPAARILPRLPSSAVYYVSCYACRRTKNPVGRL
jgi:hypothetical protein